VAAGPARSLMAVPGRGGSEAGCTALPLPITGAVAGLAPGEAGQLQLSASDRAGVAVVSVRGELDLLALPVLQAYLSDLRSLRAARSVADLTGLAFLDCACLGVLVRHCKQIRGQGGSFALAGPQAAVRRILAVTGLLTWFEVHDTVGEAVASVARGSPVFIADAARPGPGPAITASGCDCGLVPAGAARREKGLGR
jgi:anti-sigma B factor antagonist